MPDRGHDRLTLDGHELELSHLDKVLFPGAGIAKGAVVDYYRRIAEVALPHFRDRPLSLRRFPDGIGEGGFFQKEMPGHFPNWIHHASLPKEGGSVTYVIADDAATLAYLANQGTVEMHVALARRDKPDHPDRMVFDLDPSDDDFEKVRQAAFKVRRLLDGLALPSFVQTTGSRGLHVVVPLDRGAGFDAVRDFAHRLGERLEAEHPEDLTVAQRKDQRRGRVFIDYLRNAYGQTMVAPYSLRAIEGAPVATPIRWDELGSRGLTARKYTIGNIFRRLARTSDPWSSLGGKAPSLDAARARLADLD